MHFHVYVFRIQIHVLYNLHDFKLWIFSPVLCALNALVCWGYIYFQTFNTFTSVYKCYRCFHVLYSFMLVYSNSACFHTFYIHSYLFFLYTQAIDVFTHFICNSYLYIQAMHVFTRFIYIHTCFFCTLKLLMCSHILYVTHTCILKLCMFSHVLYTFILVFFVHSSYWCAHTFYM